MSKKWYLGGFFAGLATLAVWLAFQGSVNPNNPGSQIVKVFDGDTYANNATSYDTSGVIALKGSSIVDLSGYLTGSSSATVTGYVLGGFDDQWKVVETLSSLTTASGLFEVNLRNLDTNHVGAVERIRIALTTAVGDDSTAAQKKYVNLLTR